MARVNHEVYDSDGNLVHQGEVEVDDPLPDPPRVLTVDDVGEGPGKVAPGDHPRIVEPEKVSPAARAAAATAAKDAAGARDLTRLKSVVVAYFTAIAEG